MTIFNDFSDSGEFLGKRDEPLNETNFSRFEKERGSEQAKGYLIALQELTHNLEQILNPPDKCIPQTPHLVRTNLVEYVNHNKFLIGKLISILAKPPLENIPQPK